jgi:hypothetical protein
MLEIRKRALMNQVATMDADVAITIAFCFEAFLVALALGLFIGHEIRKSRSETASESRRGYLERTAIPARPRHPAGRRT